jgi:hypothetical protein
MNIELLLAVHEHVPPAVTGMLACTAPATPDAAVMVEGTVYKQLKLAVYEIGALRFRLSGFAVVVVDPVCQDAN